MAEGTSDDPIILDPTYRFAVRWVSQLFNHREDDVQMFIEAESPQIRANVSPGQCFAFSMNKDTVFILLKDENDALYFMRWPAMSNFPRIYLVPEEESRPWLSDKINELNRKVRELNPFQAIDKFIHSD